MLRCFAASSLHKFVLRLVRVLVLINEQMQESILVVLTHRFDVAKQEERAQQQVVEVERRSLVQLAFVRVVDTRDLLLEAPVARD